MLIYGRRERVNSALRNGDRINVALDNVEAMLHSLTGLVNPILMARALRTGTGRYSEVHHQLRTIMRGASSLDAPHSSQLGNHVAFMDEDRLSSSSGDSVFNIEPATQEVDPPKSSGTIKASATSPPPQSHSSTIRSPSHDGDPLKLRIQQESGQGTREMIEINRENQWEIQEKGKIEQGGQWERQKEGRIKREDQREIREPERPAPMIMSATAAAGIALGGAAIYAAEEMSLHGSEDQHGSEVQHGSEDQGGTHTVEDSKGPDDGDEDCCGDCCDGGCCGDCCECDDCCGDCCIGCCEGEDEGCCYGCCDCNCGWWLCGRWS